MKWNIPILERRRAANRGGDRGVQLGMNRTSTSSSKSRRRVAALATIGVLAVGAATTANASDPAYGPEPSEPAEAAGVAAVTETTAAASEGTEAMTEGTADPNAVVHTAETHLGTILVDQAGFTLYAFLNDTEGESTCTGDCLANWPVVPAPEGDLNVGALDAALFSTVENPEAGPMLKMGDWPLYTFAADAAPGDINGQGVGGVWFVVGPSGNAATLFNTRETSAGPILVDAQGMTLYAFLNDTEGESTCTGDCLANWPAASIGEMDPGLLDPALWSTVENPEAGAMLKIGDWPLYTFAADEAPGDVNGQGVGEVWYAVAPDGSIVEGDITVAEFAPAPPSDTTPTGTAPATTG
jgi:predicted lipoprotein with Yx(FWY)xxD motif